VGRSSASIRCVTMAQRMALDDKPVHEWLRGQRTDLPASGALPMWVRRDARTVRKSTQSQREPHEIYRYWNTSGLCHRVV